VKVVVDLQDRRSIWGMPPWLEGRLREGLPAGSSVVLLDVPADGSGDGVARTPPEVLAAVADADVYLGYGVPADILRHGRRLRWIHSAAAGVRNSLTPEMLASPVLFTNSAGVHAPPMAESVLAMMLHFARGFDLAARAQAAGRWDSAGFYAGDAPLREFSGSTVGVVGFGGIGREVAWRAAVLGARVLGLRRGGPADSEVPLEASPGGGAVATARVLTGAAGLRTLLEASDYVVLAAPHTEDTDRLIDARALGHMKPSAVLVNVARGALVDEDALVRALASGRLRGAGLDVFATEPLPAGHPLWSAPGVLLTPHVSGVSRGFWAREADLITENLRRFLAGRPLVNLVDKHAGY